MVYLLIPLTLSFAEQKFLILTKFGLSIIFLMDFAFGLYLRRHHQTQDHLGFLLRNLQVL